MIITLDSEIGELMNCNKYVYEKYDDTNKTLYPEGQPPGMAIECECDGNKHVVCFLICTLKKYRHNPENIDKFFVFKAKNLDVMLNEANSMAVTLWCNVFFISV